jgi:hypothetical protein
MLGEANQIFGLIRLAKWIGSLLKRLRKPQLPVKRTLIEAKELQWGGLHYRSFRFEQIEPPSDDSPTGRTIEQA